MVCDPTSQPVVAGDVKLTVRNEKGKTLAAAWFHTAFIEGETLQLAKPELDKAKKNKALPADFGMVVTFGARPQGDEEIAKERASLLVRARDSFVGGAAPAAGLLGTSESNDQMEEEDDEDDGDHVLAGGGSASSVGEVEAGRI